LSRKRPWATERKKLFAAAAWDALVLASVYIIVYRWRLGVAPEEWAGWAKTAICWITLSYLFGRYSGNNNRRDALTARAKRVAGVAGAIVFATVFHGWVSNSSEAATRLKGFLIPLLTGSMVLSETFWLVSKHSGGKVDLWLVAPREEHDIIRKEVSSMRIEDGVIDITDEQDLRARLKKAVECSREIVVSDGAKVGDEEIEEILLQKGLGGKIYRLLNWCEVRLARIPPELASKEWLLNEVGMSLQAGGLAWRIKRLGDVVATLILLVLLWPLMIVVAILVWLEDRGPVLYRQKRTGLHGKIVTIVKFRSMKVDAEKAGAEWSGRGDHRITKVGRIIRKCRIDEMPQLLSVLSGDLSLIGPRPERPEIEIELEKVIPHYRARHWIRPGLSGWAQVNYPYGASVADSRNKLGYDLYYLKNVGIGLDLLIFVKTIKLVMMGQGAIAQAQAIKRE